MRRKHDIEAYFLGRIVRGHPQLTPVDQVVAEDKVTTRVEVRNDGARATGFELHRLHDRPYLGRQDREFQDCA